MALYSFKASLKVVKKSFGLLSLRLVIAIVIDLLALFNIRETKQLICEFFVSFFLKAKTMNLWRIGYLGFFMPLKTEIIFCEFVLH